jgi:RNA polymerase sigma factor (TIGR02999 family)
MLELNTDINRILNRAQSGDSQPSEELLPLLYSELRALAAIKLKKEKPGISLSATALVHEVYVRLVGSNQTQSWQNRAHFFGAAAEAMRRILLERARRKKSLKHGGGLVREEMDLEEIVAPGVDEDLVHLDDALNKLAVKDPVKAQLVNLRYFAGLSGEEAAEMLGISPATADRYWAYAKAWLHREITRGSSG